MRQLEGVMKETEETAMADHVEDKPGNDYASALQLFLDGIPINSSIPGIKNALGNSFVTYYRHLFFSKDGLNPTGFLLLVATGYPMLSMEFVFLSRFNLQILELKTGDNVKNAIELLYTKNAFGALIADVLDPDITVGRFSDRYIGFIDFATMVLWSLEVI